MKVAGFYSSSPYRFFVFFLIAEIARKTEQEELRGESVGLSSHHDEPPSQMLSRRKL
jgi:hypothetical protein